MKLVFSRAGVVGLVLAFVLFESLFACASENAHQYFKIWLQREIGRSIDDPGTYINRYPEYCVTTRDLPDGNVEEECKGGHLLRCKVYFAIDKSSRRIIDDHYEGTDQNCSLNH